MADMRKEPRLCCIGLFGHFAGTHEAFFMLLALTDIARYPENLNKSTLGIGQREGEDLCPEGAAILAIVFKVSAEYWRLFFAGRCRMASSGVSPRSFSMA
jgi:hypothetical protein